MMYMCSALPHLSVFPMFLPNLGLKIPELRVIGQSYKVTISQWSHTLYSTRHTLWGCAVELASLALTAATVLADAAVTLPSPK